MNQNILDSIFKTTENQVDYLLFLSKFSDSFNFFKINDLVREKYIEITSIQHMKNRSIVQFPSIF